MSRGDDSELRRVFESFATFGDRLADGTTMDNGRFAKLTRDSAILDAHLTPIEADIIFSRVKKRTQRRINFTEFKHAVVEMARAKYGADPDGAAHLTEAIVAAGGPLLDQVHLPRADGVFDKLTSPASYTGSHRERFSEDGRGRGLDGRTQVSAVADISSELRASMQRGGSTLASAHADRSRELYGGSVSPSKIGGHPNRSVAAAAAHDQTSRSGGTDGGGVSGFSGKAAHLHSMLSAQPTYSSAMGDGDAHVARARSGGARSAAVGKSRVMVTSKELEAVFSAYCVFGQTSRATRELDSARFAKLCRENDIVDGRSVTPATVDLAFSKAKQGKKRTLSYSDFQQALAILAPQRLPDLDIVTALQTLVEKIIASGGPSVSGVSIPNIAPTSIFAKLTDDSLYTGTHRHRFDEDGVGLGRFGRD